MKSLITLVVLTALVAFGGAFLEKWKIPGLENFPTAESVKARFNKVPEAEPIEEIALRRMEKRREAKRNPGYYPPAEDSASVNRNKQILKGTKEMEQE